MLLALTAAFSSITDAKCCSATVCITIYIIINLVGKSKLPHLPCKKDKSPHLYKINISIKTYIICIKPSPYTV